MVARKEVYFHALVRQFANLAQQARVPFGDDCTIFIPEIKYVYQKINRFRLVLYIVQEVDQAALMRPSVGYRQAA